MECIPMEALGTLETLGPDDPARRHADTCPRCGAMVFAYREFVRAEAPTGANVRDADARLAAFIAERVDGIATTGASRRPHRRWFEMPTFRFVAAAAVMVVVAGVVAKRMQSPEQAVLRGDPRVILTLEAPRTLGDGSIELRWSAIANADAYQVVLLREDLTEVARMLASGERELTLTRDAIPAGATHWQVTALREGGVLTESAPEALPK